ncbi:hypothetical protein [Phenylobacterium sp.]|uniref:hypothetical protein n=1 Tax=Phenylobacterium sp. TaxID=1871053 RepID=UPI0025DDC3F0|nr:hypothetical protein [Phenylobacterium sp.]MBX3481902.1 hypothetical protein [Phenylobacterium sp.]MCW5758745.1 hypothetical protein [Phenylobacterium sp.]
MTVTCCIRYVIDPFQKDAFEAYRARLKLSPQGAANFAFAQEARFILSEERTWPTPVV